MRYNLSLKGTMPSPVEWVAIITFIVGAIAFIPQYVTLSTMQFGIISLIIAVLGLAAKTIVKTDG